MECPPGGNIATNVLSASVSCLVNLGSERPVVSHSSFSLQWLNVQSIPFSGIGYCLERCLVMTQSRYSQLITSSRPGREDKSGAKAPVVSPEGGSWLGRKEAKSVLLRQLITLGGFWIRYT